MGPFRKDSDIGSSLRLQDDADDNNNNHVKNDDDNIENILNREQKRERAIYSHCESSTKRNLIEKYKNKNK